MQKQGHCVIKPRGLAVQHIPLKLGGLAGVATQVALYMSASGDGTARDGGGGTCACGPRAADVRELLTRGGTCGARW